MQKAVLVLTFLLIMLTLEPVLARGAAIVIDDYVFNNIYINSYYDLIDSYSLGNLNLRLPDEENDDFNDETEHDLKALASLYGNRQPDRVGDEIGLIVRDDEYIGNNFLQNNINLDRKSLKINPVPGLSLNADFIVLDDDDIKESNSNLNLFYELNSKTTLRAGYGLANKEWWDYEDIILEDNDGNNGIDENIDEDNMADGDSIDDEMSEEESTSTLEKGNLFLDSDRSEASLIGISYKTSDYLTLSADYINNIVGEEDVDYSTVLGLAYADNGNQLKYHYQIDFGDAKTTETGIEIGYRDLLTFNASYKLLDPDQLKNQLAESVWDFGVGFKLDEKSSISFGYQLIKNEESDDISLETDKESNLKAQLEIKF
ncbi:hypothetical protein GM661_02400 [Iocasia frigidifontis]|uniref:Porin n=1 Tax=Iocasia fonsfrigidae TaxID=2682810 RepID=A0A8A7K5D2_9FIRM|nr:hypothetical protein [Iocasia fonsfrigidae]QTL96906.1 hypothetical protein GM661_02400 [Iocasia fonsfrigidae]